MKLDEWQRRKPGRQSAVDLLPDEVRAQLIAARQAGTHSVGSMAEWLAHEGYETVTASALSNWFQSRGVPHGSGRGVA